MPSAAVSKAFGPQKIAPPGADTKRMDRHAFCVIMAGGGGNRFWPVTRESRPKQFINSIGTSLLRAAYERFVGIVPEENILIITQERFQDTVRGIVPELPPDNLLLEPYVRKTGPCLAYATYSILQRDPDAVLAVTPCDLMIADRGKFRSTLEEAFEYVREQDVLMFLGVKPLRPDPGYGYIQVQGGRHAVQPGRPAAVKSFMEKPSEDLARVFVKSGEFLWNSGIFTCQADVLRAEMEEYMPQITCQFDGWQGAIGTPAQHDFVEHAYSGCDKLSIDYGVMEKTSRAMVWPAEFGWSDIDSWKTLWDSYPEKDGDANLISGGTATLSGARKNIIVERNPGKLVALCGLDDYMVIDTDDVLFICPRDDARYQAFLSGIDRSGRE